MWLVKKAASKVATITEKVLREDSEAEKIVKDIISNKHQVMPVKQMSKLATLSFDMEKFQHIVEFVTQKLKDLKIEKKSLKKRLNLLVLVSYLIKHGASGFIDQFRLLNDTFTKYEILAVTDKQEEKDLYPLKLEVSERANHIKTLLSNKSMLAKEKELARKIKEKIMCQGGVSENSKAQKSPINEEKMESFLEHYVWRYTSKLDKKLDDVADVLIAKIDLYLDGDMPESFEIDELQAQQATVESEWKVEEKQKENQSNYMKGKVPFESVEAEVKNEDLIDLNLVQEKPIFIEGKEFSGGEGEGKAEVVSLPIPGVEEKEIKQDLKIDVHSSVTS